MTRAPPATKGVEWRGREQQRYCGKAAYGLRGARVMDSGRGAVRDSAVLGPRPRQKAVIQSHQEGAPDETQGQSSSRRDAGGRADTGRFGGAGGAHDRRQSFEGTIIASGESGKRTVVNSLIVARGVFTGSGRIVEVDNRPWRSRQRQPGQPRVPAGHHAPARREQDAEDLADPQTCALTIRIQQTGRIQGGTRMFRDASGTFTGSVRVWGVAVRNPDGSCSQEADLLLEGDVVSARGTLSF